MLAPKPRLNVRPPDVAGSFYPRGESELKAIVESLLAEPKSSGRGRLLGVIAPHAGYMHSGPIAASAFAEVPAAGHSYARVLLIGPPHYVSVRGIAASSAKAFATPLGDVPIDTDAIGYLVDRALSARMTGRTRPSIRSRSSCRFSKLCSGTSRSYPCSWAMPLRKTSRPSLAPLWMGGPCSW